MISLLTKYLLQYRRVSIPHIGTFEIIQHSPQLNVPDKLLTPPYFTTKYKEQDNVPEHQFSYFAQANEVEKEKLKEELFLFGRNLRNKIQAAPFKWNGFGILRYGQNELLFEPLLMELPALQGIPAVKVIRKNAEHSMLVGDREMTAVQVNHALHPPRRRRPVYMTIGWVLLILSLLAIAYILYEGKFQTGSTGLKLKG